MPFELKNVVPWGRSFEEYTSMFSLSQDELNLKILGCSDGPASFNATMNRLGKNCISIDPLYQFTKNEIKNRIDESFHEVLEQARKNKNEFIWKNIKTVKELGDIRKEAMEKFLADYELGKKEGRYIYGELPHIHFINNQFDIALCSHFLFLYSKQFSFRFHLDSIIELCRVAKEVRIFPILELGSKISRHFDKICKILSDKGYQVKIKKVAYEFQKGGNQLLIVN